VLVFRQWHPEGWRDSIEMEGRITKAGYWRRGREVAPEQSRKKEVEVQPIRTGAGQFYDPDQELPISALPSPNRIGKVRNAPLCGHEHKPQEPWFRDVLFQSKN
jgi:hypothetical protein